jgi:hypothetical protein
MSLTTANVVRTHITASLTAIHIYDTATLVGCDEIVSVLRNVIISDTWSGAIAPLDVLALGERQNDSQLVGLALYRIMLLGRDYWLNEPRITLSHGELLANGILRFYEEWETVAKSWAETDGGRQPCPRYNSCSTYWQAFQSITSSSFPPYDVIGRLRLLEGTISDCSTCTFKITRYASDQREQMEKKIPDLFSLRKPLKVRIIHFSLSSIHP